MSDEDEELVDAEEETAGPGKKVLQNMEAMLGSIHTEKDFDAMTNCGVTEACFKGAPKHLKTYKYIWGRVLADKKINNAFIKREWDITLPSSADDPKLYADVVVFATAKAQADSILEDMEKKIESAPRDSFYKAVIKARNRLRDIAAPLGGVFGSGNGINTKTVSYAEAGSLVEPPAQKWLVKGLVPDDWPTFFYGMGGSAKSYLAVLLALVTAVGGQQFMGVKAFKRKVMYIDWEMGEPTFRSRVNKAANGLGINIDDGVPNLHYKRLIAPLSEHLDEVIEECKARDIGLVIIDSFGFSMTGQDTNKQPDVTAQMARLAQIPAPCVIIDHISKEGKGEQGPFGSVYKHLAARWMWWLRVSSKERCPDGEVKPGIFVRMFNAKHNIAAQHDDIFLHIVWDDPYEPHKITLALKKPEDVPESLTQGMLKEGEGNGNDLSPEQEEFLNGVRDAYEESHEPVTKEAMRLFMGTQMQAVTRLAKSLEKLGLVRYATVHTGSVGKPLRGYLLVGQVESLEDVEEDEDKV